jgi:hypothetical protein
VEDPSTGRHWPQRQTVGVSKADPTAGLQSSLGRGPRKSFVGEGEGTVPSQRLPCLNIKRNAVRADHDRSRASVETLREVRSSCWEVPGAVRRSGGQNFLRLGSDQPPPRPPFARAEVGVRVDALRVRRGPSRGTTGSRRRNDDRGAAGGTDRGIRAPMSGGHSGVSQGIGVRDLGHVRGSEPAARNVVA